MAPQADLRRIGSEGFALIDKFYGRRRANGNRVCPSRKGHWVVQVPNDEMEETPMNSREAAARYGGIIIVTYPKPLTHLKP